MPISAIADEIGTVTATLDGQERQWFTISLDLGNGQEMSVRFKNDDRLTDFALQAHPEPQFTSTDILTINVSYFGPYAEGKAPVDVEITHAPDGLTSPVWTSARMSSTPLLEFDVLDLSSDPGHATGSFSAELCLAAGLLEDPDPDNCKPISGSFDTDLMVR